MHLIDPFLWQLVLIPIFTIGIGVALALKTEKVWIAPLVTFVLNTLTELVTMITYYEASLNSLRSWNVVLPTFSFLIAYTFVGKRRIDQQLSNRP